MTIEIGSYAENEFPPTIRHNLLDSGRVIDGNVIPAPTPAGSSRNRDLDTISRMNLKTGPIARPRVERFPAAAGPAAPETAAVPAAPIGVAAPVRERPNMVWESGPLTRRPLTIPTAANTNPTGSMLFTKGNLDIDQQIYFRDEVFDRLAWRADPRTAGKELAEADFLIVIRLVDYGVHRLTVTHDTRTNTISYRQHQPMSALRWGTARPLIARDDLLNRTMRLYRDGMNVDTFVMEID